MTELRQAALEILALTEPLDKVSRVFELFDAYQQKRVSLNSAQTLWNQNTSLPGRPERPRLVPPLEVPRRKMDTIEGRASLLHSLAHIEFNAINCTRCHLALSGYAPTIL